MSSPRDLPSAQSRSSDDLQVSSAYPNPEIDRGVGVEEALQRLSEQIHRACALDPRLDATSEPAVLGVYLAHLFVRDVSEGGFAQFFYNMQGNYLLESEQLLEHAGADSARGYYRAAVDRCVDSVDTYQAFLEGDYQAENEVKRALHLLTVDYFRGGGNPAAELADFLRLAEPQVNVWLEMAVSNLDRNPTEVD